MGALKLNTTEFDKFKRNLFVFIIPLALVYLAQMGMTLGAEGNIIETTDFIPNPLTIGGMIQYVSSVLIDYKKKFDESN